MLREISCGQLDEWIAFYQLEPWGLAVIDNLFAHFKAIFVNMNLPKGKMRMKPEKFLLWPDKPRRVDSELGEPDDFME